MITVAFLATFVLAGAGLANAPAGEAGADATVVAAEAVPAADHGLNVTRYTGADGETMVCIAERDFATILAWCQEQQEAREHRAQFERGLGLSLFPVSCCKEIF